MKVEKTVIVDSIEEVLDIVKNKPTWLEFREILDTNLEHAYLVVYEDEFYTRSGGEKN